MFYPYLHAKSTLPKNPQKITYNCCYHNTPICRIQVILPLLVIDNFNQLFTIGFVYIYNLFPRPFSEDICRLFADKTSVFCSINLPKMLTIYELSAKIEDVGVKLPTEV